jgi:hypothetical protein
VEISIIKPVLVAERSIAGTHAATLAWHGRCPVSGLRAFHAEACENSFDLMSILRQLLRRYSKGVAWATQHIKGAPSCNTCC